MSASNESKSNREANSADDEGALDLTKVHSANSWETADLGDDDRKKKFLRLMGASKEKTDHHGKIVIGDTDSTHTHGRDQKQTEQIEQELEDQYKHTFEHRITKWSHKGLGFDDDTKKPSEEPTQPSTTSDNKTDTKPTDTERAEEAKNKDINTKSSEQVGQKRENSEPAKDPVSPPKKPKMMMNFVKASD